ncbi:hypothetical protein LOK49_LG06G02818 [Camellia lanceoleosa]|uniref:Uncharacterized protein n=1 Tax=Camellia lanceoleosa TaxID=1840588 RepID=A0ACC0HKV0_9ERIC|nr:hypothetical protein LOK49_LG06G02818 [Camellia lanceoleosa]
MSTRPSKILAKAKKVWVKAKEEWVKAKEEWPIKALAKALAPLAKALSPRARALAPLAEALAPGNISKSRETNLIVATLIATVAFAAGITMPGGYIVDNKDPNQGMAILTRKKAFKAFVITDTIALTLSIFAVLSHLGTMTDHPILLKRQLALAVTCTTYAMIAMFLAFITGTYAVLASSSLSIFVCVIPSILLVIHLTYSHIYFPLLISEDIQPFSPPLSPPSEQNV